MVGACIVNHFSHAGTAMEELITDGILRVCITPFTGKLLEVVAKITSPHQCGSRNPARRIQLALLKDENAGARPGSIHTR
jgi:hypothetical protein